MQHFTTNTPKAAVPNVPNTPVQADNATVRPNVANDPNAANTYAPETSRENTPAAPGRPNSPNTPNAPNTPRIYKEPETASPAIPNQPNSPNQANEPNIPNTPGSSLSQGNVPNSANQPMGPNQPNRPNTANTPALSQNSGNTYLGGQMTAGSENRSGTRSKTGNTENSTVQPLPSGRLPEHPSSAGTLGMVFLAVLLLTLTGTLSWKRIYKKKKDAATDRDGSETPPTGL